MTFNTSKTKSSKIKSFSIPLLLLVSVFGWLAGGALSSAYAADLLDINRADAVTIAESVSGLGPVKAQAIVDYRNQNGKFTALEDLRNVPGIGQIMFDRIKASLTLSTEDDASGATAKLDPLPQ